MESADARLPPRRKANARLDAWRVKTKVKDSLNYDGQNAHVYKEKVYG